MLDNIFFVVAALTSGDRIDAQFVQVHRVILPDAESTRGTFAIRDDEIDALILPDFG
jgi:hypothetical protein